MYYTFAAFMLSIALVYFTSAVQVFFKDMAQIVGICLQFGMWLTPIMWQVEQFSGSSFYPILCKLVKFNPMYYVVVGYRDSMIMGKRVLAETGTDPVFLGSDPAAFTWGAEGI